MYEDVEVYIAYIENDETGRRTMDSIIAGELYKALESANIKAFYERISVADIIGDEYEKACDFALKSMKIIVVTGSSKENFDKIVRTYGEYFSNKIVIPVYADMSADDLPRELKELQALNYNSVGATASLTKNILDILGRDNEIDILNFSAERKRKNRIITIVFTICLSTILIGVATYLILGKLYVQPSKKYKYAEQMIEMGNYVNAIDVLSNIDYKNSNDLLKSAYDKYIGYYQNDDKTIGLHVSISENSVASIEIDKKTRNGIIKIIENAQIDKNLIKLSFNDSENNQGDVFIELKNNGLNLTIKMNNDVNGDIDAFFDLNKKSDKPFMNEITASMIKNWLKNKATKFSIQAEGYEIAFYSELHVSSGGSIYNIVNTDINVALYSFDLSNRANHYDDEQIVGAFSVPAMILTPTKIGDDTIPYVDNDILYIPNSTIASTTALNFTLIDESNYIKEDTIISCTSKYVVGDEIWKDLLDTYIYQSRIKKILHQKYGDVYTYLTLESENDTHYLYSAIEERNSSFATMCKINKNTYDVEILGSVPYIVQPYSSTAEWYIDPKIIAEFPIMDQ